MAILWFFILFCEFSFARCVSTLLHMINGHFLLWYASLTSLNLLKFCRICILGLLVYLYIFNWHYKHLLNILKNLYIFWKHLFRRKTKIEKMWLTGDTGLTHNLLTLLASPGNSSTELGEFCPIFLSQLAFPFPLRPVHTAYISSYTWDSDLVRYLNV